MSAVSRQPQSAPAPAAKLRAVAPVFLVADVVKAAAYYADALGFTVPRMWGEPPHFCIAIRDGLEVMLNQVGDAASVHPNAVQDGRLDAYFVVDDADALFAEYEAKRADLVCPPQDQLYGMRDFTVRDLDGHLMAFGHDLTGARL